LPRKTQAWSSQRRNWQLQIAEERNRLNWAST
jgi:hypothetical protein